MSTRSSHGAVEMAAPPRTSKYTVQEAIDHIGFGWFQYKVVLLTGLCMSYEATGVVTLALLSNLIKCDYQLTSLQQATIPTTGLIGMCVSNPLWGKMADQYGRRWVLILSTASVGYFGILTSFSPNIPWIYINIFLTGVYFGGTFQSTTLCSEYAPTKDRLKAMMILEVMYSITMISAYLLAKSIVPRLGWSWFMMLCSLPEVIFMFCAFYLPESARFLLVSGQHNIAQKLVDTIAKENGKQPLEGCLSKVANADQRLGKVSDLFSGRLIRVSIPLIVTWFVTGLCYFGINVIIPTVFVEADGCHGSDIKAMESSTDHCLSACRELTAEDFTSIVIASAGELSALPVAMTLMLFLGRRTSLVVLFSIHSLSSFVSMICMPRAEITGIMFVTRTSIAAVYFVICVFIVEVYPTTCRSIGVGVSVSFYKLGALLSPVIGQALASYRVLWGFLTFGLFGVSGIVAVYLIPIETKNKQLKDTEAEEEEVEESR